MTQTVILIAPFLRVRHPRKTRKHKKMYHLYVIQKLHKLATLLVVTIRYTMQKQKPYMRVHVRPRDN